MLENILKVKQAYTDEVLETLPMNDWLSVDKLLEQASQQHKKGVLPAYQRLTILQKLAGLMQAEHEDLARLIANEGGKPLLDARVEVTRAIDGIRIAMAVMQNSKGEEIPMDLTAAGEGRLAFTTLEPIGVVVAVSAFNHPLNLIVHQVVPAIAVGCPVIVKPATATPLSCLRFIKLVHQAGLPTSWAQAVLTSNEDSQRLVTDTRVAFFSFIGSARIGWMLKSKLASGTRCALEHGGVAPVIFDNYADEDAFVKGVVKASFYHGGQVCVSVQRIFVHEEKAEAMVQLIAAAADKLVVGDAIEEKTEVGPLISEKEVDRVETWVNEAVAEGAKLITGGKRLNNKCYVPTVLFNPSQDSKVSTLEIFGPVVCIYSYSDIKTAIEIANSLPVSFQASVFSDNINTALNTAKSLEASAVIVNDYSTFRVDWMPFAGRKHSGYGVGGIGHTMSDMQEAKMIVLKHG